MWTSKLFWRIFAIYSLLLLVAGTALVTWFSSRQQSAMMAQLRSNLHNAAVLLEGDAAGIIAGELPRPRQQEWAAHEAETGIRVTLIDAGGAVIADTSGDAESMDNHGNRPEVQQAQISGEGWSERTSSTLKLPMLYHAHRLGRQNAIVGYVRTAIPMSEVHEQISAVRQVVTGLGIGLCVVAMGLTYLIVRRIVLPLREMTSVSEKIASGDLSTGTSVETGDELETLGDSLNNMRRQMQVRLEQLNEQNRTILESSERLRTVLGAMIEGVLAVDRERRILFANSAALATFDISSTNYQNRPLVEVIRHPRMLEVVDEVLQSRKQVREEIELPRKDLVVSMFASRLPGDPAEGVVMVFHDITDLRRLENLRREFVANVSHELKTPLASIQACTETLLEGAIDDASINRNFLGKIATQADRLLMLILDMIKIAQVEGGREVYDLGAVSVREAILDTLGEHDQLAEAKQVELHYEAPTPEADAEVYADHEGVRTILTNLFDNAIKYTGEGGRVVVSWEVRDNRVRIHVRDTGVGISPRHLERIFERFYRVDKARSRELGGTGLGLSIVKHLVQVFGGSISVESRLGEGSTFTIELPQS